MGIKFSYKAFSIGVFLIFIPLRCLRTGDNLLVGMRSLSSSAGAGRKYQASQLGPG